MGFTLQKRGLVCFIILGCATLHGEGPVKEYPIKNPSKERIVETIRASRVGAARQLVDPRDGTVWIWPAELSYHGDMARRLKIPYTTFGGGDVLIIDE